MIALVDKPKFRMPAGVASLEGFRRWAASDSFPDEGRFSCLGGELWVDSSTETVLHSKVKTRFVKVLDTRVEEGQLGHLLIDRMRLSHPEAELSTEPEAIFFTHDALERQRVQLARDIHSIEVVGSPEMVLEVVSDTSEDKDTVDLPILYFKAGIQEYWLVDPRHEELRFDILRRGRSGFVPTRYKAGWVKSVVFGRSFRLIRKSGSLTLAEFSVEMK